MVVKEKLKKKATFISPKYPEHDVILKPDSTIMIGLKQQFVAGIHAVFHKGFFSTDDPEIADLMRSSRYLGMAEGFYEDKSYETVQEITNRMKQRKEAIAHNFFCKICSKGFDTSLQMGGHLRSNAHKAKEKADSLAVKVRKGAIG